jgi:CxxC-x17-CxxC domain-containing protein
MATQAPPGRLVGVRSTEVARVPYTDKTLTCRDCGQTFVFSAGEQDFFASHGLMHEPARCPECRALRKAQRGATGDGPFTGQRTGSRQYFEATCSACGQVARLPFEPRLDRPVYCSDCFSRQPRPSGARTERY